MRTALQMVRLLTVVLWVGGLAFFAFVLAPVAFGRLPSPHIAGLVVGGTLRVLHQIGLVCGGLFLVTTALRARRGWRIESVLVVLMLAATAYSQFHILPAMERDRSLAGGEIEAAPRTNPGREDFDRLHGVSEKVEGLVFFAGLGLILSMSRQESVRSTAL